LAIFIVAVLLPAPFAWRRPCSAMARGWGPYAIACTVVAYALWPEPYPSYLEAEFPMWPRAAAYLAAAVVLMEIVVVIPLSRRTSSSLPFAALRNRKRNA